MDPSTTSEITLSNEELNYEYKFIEEGNEEPNYEYKYIEEERYSTNYDEPILEKVIVKNVKPRLYWVDWLRIYSSVLVIYNHASHVNAPRKFREGNWSALYFHCALSKCCVPLFIMISGIFFLNPNKEISIERLYKKNILRIVKSLYFWSFIHYLFMIVVNHTSTTKYDLKFFRGTIFDILSGVGHFWYLYFIIGLYITTPFYRAIVAYDRKTAWYCASLCLILGQFLPTFKDFLKKIINMDISLLDTIHNHFHQGIEVTGGMATYYFFGYLLYSYDFETKKLHRYIVHILGIIGVVFTVIFRYISSYKANKEDESFGLYTSINVGLYTFGVFIFFKCVLSRLINVLIKYKFIKYITKTFSECSFGVYLIHMTVYNVIYHFGFSSQSYNSWYFVPVYTIIIYMTTFIIVFILRKIKFFRDVL